MLTSRACEKRAILIGTSKYAKSDAALQEVPAALISLRQVDRRRLSIRRY